MQILDTDTQQQTVTRQQQPYLFLISSTQSFPTRQTATTATKKDEAVYRRAGAPTPAENAKRDFAADSLAVHIKELQQESADILWCKRESAFAGLRYNKQQHKDRLLVLRRRVVTATSFKSLMQRQ
jgi:hypothetical protein